MYNFCALELGHPRSILGDLDSQQVHFRHTGTRIPLSLLVNGSVNTLPIMFAILTSATNGYDGSMMNNLQSSSMERL